MSITIRPSEAGFEDGARERLSIIDGFPDAEGKLTGQSEGWWVSAITRLRTELF